MTSKPNENDTADRRPVQPVSELAVRELEAIAADWIERQRRRLMAEG